MRECWNKGRDFERGGVGINEGN
jgi:hypothetical protein